MRILVTILAISATPAAAAILWMRAHPQPPPATIPVHSVVWGDRVFTNAKELRRWLRGHGERYTVWAKKHPVEAAALERRQVPKKRAAVRKAAPAAPRAERDTSSGPDIAFIALLLALASTGVLTFRLRRRLRVPRPRVTLPAIDVDLRAVARGLERRVGQLRVPKATPAPPARTQASAPAALLDRAVAASPQPAGNGALGAASVLDPSPALSYEPAGNGAITGATPVSGYAVVFAHEPPGNGSRRDPEPVSDSGGAMSSLPPVNGSLAEAAPILDEAVPTSPEPLGDGSLDDVQPVLDHVVAASPEPADSPSLAEAPPILDEAVPTPPEPPGNRSLDDVQPVLDQVVSALPESADSPSLADAAPVPDKGAPAPAAPEPAREDSIGDALRARPRAAASSRKRRRAVPKPPQAAVDPAVPATADVQRIETDADAAAVPPVLPHTDTVPTGEWELCTTGCWRGYMAARFYAHPRGDGTAILESPSFDWWGWQPDPRDRAVAQAALDELCRQLEEEGWEPFARGDAWYEVRFRRRPRVEW